MVFHLRLLLVLIVVVGPVSSEASCRTFFGGLIGRLSPLASSDQRIGSVGPLELSIVETAGTATGKYLIPNEFHTDEFRPILSGRKGALISVGTFRTLIDASYGDFDNVILADIDSITTEFNQLHLELIAESSSREDYLQRIASFPAHSDSLEQIHRLLRMRMGPGGLYGDAGPPLLARFVEKATSDSQRLFPDSFLNSDQAFLKIQTGIREGRYAAVQVDLAGLQMGKLSSQLRAQGVRISVIDLSNALEHIGAKSLDSVKTFWANLGALPLLPDAVVLMTINTRFELDLRAHQSRADDDWIYYSLEAVAFQNALRQYAFQRRGDYNDWVKTFLD